MFTNIKPLGDAVVKLRLVETHCHEVREGKGRETLELLPVGRERLMTGSDEEPLDLILHLKKEGRKEERERKKILKGIKKTIRFKGDY